MSATPKVSVLIVSYNVRQFIDESIRSIKRSRFDGNLEIIVVDNNSFDGTVQSLSEKHPDITIISNSENMGFGKAVNLAAEKAQGEFLLIINPDTIVEENTITTLVSALENNPGTGLVGPKILNPDGSLQKACKRSFPTLSVAIPKLLGLDKVFPGSKWAGRYNLTYLDPDKFHKVDAVSGSCMMISQSLFRVVDGFDPRFFMYGEDIDLCQKVHEKGLHVAYVPETSILHFQGESVKSAPFDSIAAFYNAMILFSEKHYSRSQNWVTRVLIRTGIRIRQLLAFGGAVKGFLFSVFLDAILVYVSFILAMPIAFKEYEPLTLSKGLWPAVLVPIWIIIGLMLGVYSRYRLSFTRAALMSLTGASVAATFTYFFVNQFGFSRKVFLAATLLVTFLVPGWRILFRSLIARGFFSPEGKSQSFLFNRRTAIIGASPEGIKIMTRIHNRFDTGLDPIGFIDKQYPVDMKGLYGKFLGLTTDISTLVKKYRIQELIFTADSFSKEKIFKIMDDTKDLKLTYRISSTGQDILLGKSNALDLGDISFIDIEYNLFKPVNRIIKRFYEAMISMIILILTLPVQVVYLISGKLRRTTIWGENGIEITCSTFSSRRNFIARLPMFYLVISGKIYLVGLPIVDRTEKDPGLIAKPGLTGLHRIRQGGDGRNDEKLLYRYYIQHQNFAFDTEILIKTLLT